MVNNMEKVNKYDLPSILRARSRRKEVTNNLRDDFTIPDYIKGIGEGRKYYVRTYGCQANEADSETISGILSLMSYTKTEEMEEADVILLNTCAIRKNAEDKVLGVIGNLKHLKRANPDLIIGVCGCMAQEEEMVKLILAKYPQVDLIFGTHNIYNLPKLLHDATLSKEKVVEVFSKEGDIIENLPAKRFSNHKAWVNIMYGCDKFCTYCIVPYTRGKERSRFLEDIINEIKELISEGYKEVTLLGQNVNAYGKDLNLGYDFAKLLREVAKTGIKRIRFMTSHPWNFNDAMIEAIRDNENIMPFIHLPLQSGSNDILRKMNRRYTVESYKDLFDRIKKEIPRCAISTDIIVGFPNESDEDFEKTMEMMEYCKYDNAYTFIFSKREGTPAYRMEDKISKEVKEKRLARLNEVVKLHANMNNQAYKDQVIEVLVDGKSKRNPNILSGYSPENKLVNFSGDAKVGDLVKVKIDSVKTWALYGYQLKENYGEA